MDKTRLFQIALLLVCALSLTACGVMTVDVDVYKGPLANEERVQVEQIAVMAIGAKPLLIELRDQLESEEQKRNRVTITSLRDLEGVTNSSGYIASSSYSSKSGEDVLLYASAYAHRVNGIISLYDDLGHDNHPAAIGLLRAVNDASKAIARFEQANSISRVKGDYRATLKQQIDGLGFAWLVNDDPRSEDWASTQENIRVPDSALNQTQKAFYSLTSDDSERVLDMTGFDLSNNIPELKLAWQIYIQNMPTSKDKESAYRFPQEWLIDVASAHGIIGGDTVPESTNAQFELLTDPTVAKSIAKEVVGGKDSKRVRERQKIVADLTVHHARAALERRRALADLLNAGLRFVVNYDNPIYRDDAEWDKNMEIAAGVIASLIQYNDLFFTLQHYKVPSGEIAGGTNVADDIKGLPTNGAGSNRLTDESIDKARNKVKALLQSKTSGGEAGRLALWLIEADTTYLRDSGIPNGKDRITHGLLAKHNHNDTRRRFGIVYDEKLKSDIQTIVRSGQKELNAFYSRAAAGLEGGRLNNGLETLITQYLEAVDQYGADGYGVQEKKDKLNDALIRFAHKIAFIANSEVLLDPAGKNRDEDADATKRVKAYTQSLQVIANAIITQVNELQARGQKRLNDYPAADIERAAYMTTHTAVRPMLREMAEYTQNADIKKAINTHQQAVIDELKGEDRFARHEVVSALSKVVLQKGGNSDEAKALAQSIKTEFRWLSDWPDPPQSMPKTPAAVMDLTIATLRHDKIDAVRREGKDSQRAKYLQEAIDEALEQRETMIYIRPAMFYLRNSYPTTSAQLASSQGPWNNMLYAQAKKSMPFYEHSQRQKSEWDEAKLRAEIDRQFWQNINRVRVAGSGKTNYVVTKDDIGNWYVKKFSGDAEDMIQSAAGLAQFGIGHAINPGTLKGLMSEDATKRAEALGQVNPGLQRQREAIKKELADQGAALHKQLQAIDLDAKLKAKWQEALGVKAVPAELVASLEAAKAAEASAAAAKASAEKTKGMAQESHAAAKQAKQDPANADLMKAAKEAAEAASKQALASKTAAKEAHEAAKKAEAAAAALTALEKDKAGSEAQIDRAKKASALAKKSREQAEAAMGLADTAAAEAEQTSTLASEDDAATKLDALVAQAKKAEDAASKYVPAADLAQKHAKAAHDQQVHPATKNLEALEAQLAQASLNASVKEGKSLGESLEKLATQRQVLRVYINQAGTLTAVAGDRPQPVDEIKQLAQKWIDVVIEAHVITPIVKKRHEQLNTASSSYMLVQKGL